MGKIGRTYSRGADGCYHTRPLEGKPNAPKHKQKEEISERAKRCAEQRESDAEVCRRCTKTVCKGSAECIAKQRKIQEAERKKENETA